MPGVAVGVAAHSVRAVPASWIEAIGALRATGTASCATSTPASSAASSTSAPAEHGCTPIELLAAHRLPRARAPASSTAIHVDERDIALLAASATTVVSCPTTEGNLGDGYLPALRYRDGRACRSRSGPTRRSASIPSRRRASSRPARAARASRATACSRATGDLWGALVDAGRRSLGLSGPPGEIEIDLAHPELAGIEREDLPLRARDLRLRGHRHACRLRARSRRSGVGELPVHDHHGPRPLAAAQPIERLLHPVEIRRVRDHVASDRRPDSTSRASRGSSSATSVDP